VNKEGRNIYVHSFSLYSVKRNRDLKLNVNFTPQALGTQHIGYNYSRLYMHYTLIKNNIVHRPSIELL
jgi:hypothetical protein